jgi:hypothetical protein
VATSGDIIFQETKTPARCRRFLFEIVIPGRCQRVRAKRGPMTGSASNYDVQLHVGESKDSPMCNLHI